MEDTFDHEKSAVDKKDDATRYLDCIRLVEGGHVRRFEALVAKFDIITYEETDSDDAPAKSLLFYAIDHNDEIFVKVLLEMEVPLDKEYSRTLTAYEYALILHRDRLADLIRHHANLSPYQQRLFRVLQANDVRRCDTFIRRLRNDDQEMEIAGQGLFFAARIGSIRLLDYFLSKWKIDINIQKQDDESSFPTTALLTAIKYDQSEAAKFLLFRHADPSIKGQYDNALVSALHYQAKNDLIRLMLDKKVDLTAKHPDYKKLTLREYCVLTNRVKAKIELDAYIIRLIANGKYKRIKWLIDHGYKHINVYVGPKRNGRQLAKERYYDNIVKLIDDVDLAQMRSRQKMNY